MMVAPVGVVPRNAVGQRAVTRPGNSGAAASGMVMLPVVMNVMLASLTMNNSRTARHTSGAAVVSANAIV